MKHAGRNSPVEFARFPITRQTAADSNHTSQAVRIRESKAIIQRARLGESEEKNPLTVSNAFIGELINHFEQCVMMNGDRFFRMKVRQPAKTETQRPAWLFCFFQMLMLTLQ